MNQTQHVRAVEYVWELSATHASHGSTHAIPSDYNAVKPHQSSCRYQIPSSRFSDAFQRLEPRYKTTVLLHTAECLLCLVLFFPFTYYYCFFFFGPLTSIDECKQVVVAIFALTFVWAPVLYSIEVAMRFKV